MPHLVIDRWIYGNRVVRIAPKIELNNLLLDKDIKDASFNIIRDHIKLKYTIFNHEGFQNIKAVIILEDGKINFINPSFFIETKVGEIFLFIDNTEFNVEGLNKIFKFEYVANEVI